MAKHFEIKAAEREAEVYIYGDIGEDPWADESVAARDVVRQLDRLDVDRIRVRLNSYGGSVSDGLAIHNALRRKAAGGMEIITHNDGVAISIASLILMAGDTREGAGNCLTMIHAPWGGAIGNAKEMREFADMLDRYAEAMADSYVRATGRDKDEVLDILTDGEDHWYTAEQALEMSLLTGITEELAIAASGLKESRFASAAKQISPAVVAAKTEEGEPMSDPKKNTATEPKAADNKPVDQDAIAAKAREEALAADASRRSAIRAMAKPFMASEGVREEVEACLEDHQVTEAAARERIMNKLGEGAEPATPQGAGTTVVGDPRDQFVAAAGDILVARAMPQAKVDIQGNQFRGHTLMDLARASLERNRIDCRGWDKRKIVAVAFQSTSDFPVLLENTIHKVLQTAYTTAADTWSRFCKIGSVSDFRAHNRYRVGSIGNLDALTEHGEFKTKTIPDGEKGSITASTRGNIIAITREAIINDDLQALTDLAMMLGRAFRRTIEAAVYSLLAENSGAGPTMSDGKALFHADHGNLIASGSGGAPSTAEFDAMRVLMAKQTGVGATEYLDLRPSIWLGPIGLGGDARVVNDAQYDPDTANKLQKPNKVRGLVSDIVDTPRLTGTPHYMFADPNDAPVIEVAFLDGVQEPYIEAKDGWNVDGAELKVRGDFGVAAIDYRGAVRNAGA